MKIKNLFSPITSVSVFLILGITTHSIGWLYANTGTSFIEKSLILQTWGLSLFLFISISISGSELATNIIKQMNLNIFFTIIIMISY